MGERVHHPEELQISLLRDDMSAGVQPDSDPMVLESGLHSKALLTTTPGARKLRTWPPYARWKLPPPRQPVGTTSGT
jgi:hypothetical protein